MLERVDACMEYLPSYPEVAQEAGALLTRETVSSAEVVRVLSKDATLSARVLRLANSPFYGCSGRIGTLREALLVLGTRTLQQAVMAAGVMVAFEGKPGSTVRHWKHSLLTARVAHALAHGHLDQEVAFTAGLLHDLGRMVLAHCMKREWELVSMRAWENGEPIAAAERTTFGIDHAAVGARVADRWRLPASLKEAIGRHHSPDEGGQDMLVDVIHLADVLALAVVHGEQEVVPALSERAWGRFGLQAASVQELFASATLEAGL